MYTSSNIKSLSSARTIYNRLKSEPDFYRRKIEAMLNPEYLNIDFSKTKQYRNELITLSRTANNCADKMNTVINKINVSKNNDDKKEAEQLQTSFKKLSTDTKALANKIEGTENDFKQLDKSFQNKVSSFKIPTTKTSTLSGFGGFTVKTISRPGKPLWADSTMSFNEAKNYSAKIENTSTIDQKAINNENKIDAMTPKTDAEKEALLNAKIDEVVNGIVDLDADGNWKKIDWDKVISLFEKPNIQEHEYYALLTIYSQMEATEGASLGDNLENFLSCGTIVDSSDSYVGQGTPVSFTKFSPSPILIQMGNDLYNTVQASVPYVGDLTAADKKKFDLLAAKSSILVNNNMYGSYTIAGKHLHGDMIKGGTEKVGDPTYGTTKWLSPNSYKRVMGENSPNSSRIEIDIENPGDYTLILPKHISSSNWENDRTNLNLGDLGKIIYGPEVLVNKIRGYPSVHGLGSHAVFSNSFYTDQIAFLRPEIKEDLGFWENIVGTVTGEVKGGVVESLLSNVPFKTAAKIAAPFVVIPFDLLVEHAQNQENIATNEQVDRALSGAQYATNLAMIGGEYRVSTCNDEYMLEWQYLSPEKLETMTISINKELSKNGLPVTTSDCVESLMLEKATFIGAPYGGGLSEYDIAVYDSIISINNEGVNQ